mmetsp:Transcript_2211/g.2569  ORF Transcript_2211/g.2569 Transcript_2211/m.2569 type:complete len:309 (+) Transcript_2211:20-946(+)|eukprot:CAMPEP_0205829314 /NCGR_PEP_ID=MMETSP0206-20130828/37790_1 /ASSEMBLY_ACC=CAM_ASM_000279 /TAXON_ID=36767 /ORGANISM="Euplotes focardii, Strain TN1" /LENGTH=308 /DNA_ID=CAMNT_0053131945 /DNA_START=19 /DNA_END=945 /DNA_ORIENTATION=+
MKGTGGILRALMSKRCIAIPGAFNGLVGRAVADAGFEACYVSGGAITASAGQPDIGVLGLEYFASKINEVASASGLPVLADADTGFGEAEMCVKTVVEYARAGAAGLHIEDQVMPKRCGHLDGKTLVSREDFAKKVDRASRAREQLDEQHRSIVLCARTDAAGVEGMDAAVDRAKAYVDAGADMIFPEGLKTEADFERMANELRGYNGINGGVGPYLLANMTEFGKSPMLPLDRYSQLGYHCVIYPVSTLRSAMGAVTSLLTDLKATGCVDNSLPAMQTRQELYGHLRYTPGQEWTFPSAAKDTPPLA